MLMLNVPFESEERLDYIKLCSTFSNRLKFDRPSRPKTENVLYSFFKTQRGGNQPF